MLTEIKHKHSKKSPPAESGSVRCEPLPDPGTVNSDAGGAYFMKNKFIEKESFKHKYAKELLYNWLKDSAKNGTCELGNLKWRDNYGIFTELKFYETSDPYYFELSGGLDESKRDTELIKGDEWFDPKFDRGKILFVPDITIFHKGTAIILIEVVHTHFVSSDKLEVIKKFYRGHYVKVCQIRAEEILRHCEKPSKIEFEILYEY